MKIKKLHIQNYKSLVNLEIVEPNPFTVFAGSNGAGKSNIFEALEFLTFCNVSTLTHTISVFEGATNIFNRKVKVPFQIKFQVDFEYFIPSELVINFKENEANRTLELDGGMSNILGINALEYFKTSNETSPEIKRIWEDGINNPSYRQFFNQYSRVFISNGKLLRQKTTDDFKLNLDCSNLEKVLKRILQNENTKEEIISWLDLLIPGFNNIEIVSEPLSGTDSLVIYEKGTNKPFTKNLLSDGTWNILALLTAVYQSSEPQFLCIEEPENGLNPKVQKELVNLFRQKCEDEGHYIWLNTHSQTIVNQLTPKELILVDKVNGETKIKQLQDFDLHGLRMDEAWLTNSFGGGLPW